MNHKPINQQIDDFCERNRLSKKARLELKLLVNNSFFAGIRASKFGEFIDFKNEQNTEIRQKQ